MSLCNYQAQFRYILAFKHKVAMLMLKAFKKRIIICYEILATPGLVKGVLGEMNTVDKD